MSLLLQVEVRSVVVTDERTVRHGLEGMVVERTRAGHGFLMLILGAAFGRKQVIPTVLPVQVRAFHHLHRGTVPDRSCRFRLEPHGIHIEFGKRDAVERMMIFAEIPSLLHKVLAPVIVVEQAGIEADAVDADRIAPRPTDVVGGDQVVDAVLECAVDHLHVGVDEPESAIRIAQVGSPDPTG